MSEHLIDAACHVCGEHAWIIWDSASWCRAHFLAEQQARMAQLGETDVQGIERAR